MTIVLPQSLVVTPYAGELRYYPWLAWKNQVTFDTIMATYEDDLYPASAMSTSPSTIFWKSTSLDTQYITVANLDEEVDYFAIANHNLAGVTLSIEAITAESSPDFVEIVEAFVPEDDSDILVRFDKESYPSVRLKIVGATVIPQAAVVFVGEITVIPQGIEPGYTPIRDGQDVSLSVGYGTSGEFLGAIVEGATLQTVTPFDRLPRVWYETYMRPFVDAANRGATFFFAWSPVLRPKDVSYCWFTRSVRPVIVSNDSRYKAELAMGGLA